MKKAKTWKQRIFASLVAVCMVITLVPATAMAAGETAATEVPGQLVTDVAPANQSPASMQGPGKSEELAYYQKNMSAISKVDYDPASSTITVTANRSNMAPYKVMSPDNVTGPGWQTYYALVMNFEADVKLMTPGVGEAITPHLRAENGYGIEDVDIAQASYFVPGYLADEYKNPVVFWLNAAKDTCEFTLKYTAPNQKTGEIKVETQKITVKINDTSKLVQSVDKSKLNIDPGSPTEDEYYKINLGAIEGDIAYDAASGTVTVTADRSKMEPYYFQRDGVTEKKVFYALCMNFKGYQPADSSGELNTEIINAVDGYKILDSDRYRYQDQVNKYVPNPGEGVKRVGDEESIIFWLDARDNTRSFTLCRETTEKETTPVGDAANSASATPKVVARATQKITINVVDSPDSITPTITLDKTNATIKKGESLQLEATKSHDDARIEWDSDDEEIAIVDKNGIVAARDAGNTTVTATLIRNDAEVATATCDIEVTDDNTSDDPDDLIGGAVKPQNAAIALDKTKATIYTKAKTQNTVLLKAIVLGKSKVVTWKSSKPKIATVKNGKVTAKKAGKTIITATANGVTAKCVVTVKKPTLKLTKAKATIKKGKMVQIKVKATPQGGKIKYKSNKKKVATVDAEGLVTGKKKGTAKITVTANGVKKTFTVKVK